MSSLLSLSLSFLPLSLSPSLRLPASAVFGDSPDCNIVDTARVRQLPVFAIDPRQRLAVFSKVGGARPQWPCLESGAVPCNPDRSLPK